MNVSMPVVGWREAADRLFWALEYRINVGQKLDPDSIRNVSMTSLAEPLTSQNGAPSSAAEPIALTKLLAGRDSTPTALATACRLSNKTSSFTRYVEAASWRRYPSVIVPRRCGLHFLTQHEYSYASLSKPSDSF